MVVVDPISNLIDAGMPRDATAMLIRLIDFLKIAADHRPVHQPDRGRRARWSRPRSGISSLIDTWLLLRDIELGGERNRGLYVLKSRGMAHSNQIREFLLTPHGIELQDVYVGPEGVLTGSMRLAQEARERAEEEERVRDAGVRRRGSERRRRVIEAQIAALRADLEEEVATDRGVEAGERERLARASDTRQTMARSRKADAAKGSASNGRGGARTGA